MGFLDFIVAGMFFIGNVITEVAITVSEYIDRAKKTISTVCNDLQNKRASQKELHEINLEIADLNKIKSRDGRLSSRDNDRYQKLLSDKEKIKQKIFGSKVADNIKKVVENENSVQSNIITPDKIHILQYHIGQTVAGKKCIVCGRDMVLQFPRNNAEININNIFWGCTGFYCYPKCMATQNFNGSDIQLFTSDTVEEFSCSSSILTDIYSSNSTKRVVAQRMRQHIKEDTDDYLCPDHGMSLILREKHNPEGALDQFFLGCPMYKDGACNYIMKIKSPAQLAAVLKSYEGRGLL